VPTTVCKYVYIINKLIQFCPLKGNLFEIVGEDDPK